MSDDEYRRPQRLIVVGAGITGIKFAHRYLEGKPNAEIIILEAQSYIGGRMCSSNFEGHTVEMGANWISGREEAYENPIWKMARCVDLQGHSVDRNEEFAVSAFTDDGKNVTQEYLRSVKKFRRCHELAIKFCKERNLTEKNDINVKQLLKESGWEYSSNNAIDRTVEYNLKEMLVCDGLENLSAAHDLIDGANDVELGEDEFFVEDRRGFSHILRAMVDDLNFKGVMIHLNTEVHKIEYDTHNVKVYTKNKKTLENQVFHSEAVICTASLGVLQSGLIEFSPVLPHWKIRALNEIQMFLFSKVIVKFKTNFWGSTNQFVICSNEKKGFYPLWMRYRNTKDDEYLLLCCLGGSEAQRVESLTPNEIADEVKTLFHSVFGTDNDAADIYRPIAVKVSSWSKNPYTLGSYSCYPIDAFKEVPESDLTRGLPGTQKNKFDVVNFAGECFDDLYNGWVQGGYRSGQRVAEYLLSSNRS